MNKSHTLGKLRNRLGRLNKKVKDAAPDKQGMMTSRIREIETALKNK